MPVSLTETYDNVFSDDECRDVFQQMVLGIEYRMPCLFFFCPGPEGLHEKIKK